MKDTKPFNQSTEYRLEISSQAVVMHLTCEDVSLNELFTDISSWHWFFRPRRQFIVTQPRVARVTHIMHQKIRSGCIKWNAMHLRRKAENLESFKSKNNFACLGQGCVPRTTMSLVKCINFRMNRWTSHYSAQQHKSSSIFLSVRFWHILPCRGWKNSRITQQLFELVFSSATEKASFSSPALFAQPKSTRCLFWPTKHIFRYSDQFQGSLLWEIMLRDRKSDLQRNRKSICVQLTSTVLYEKKLKEFVS